MSSEMSAVSNHTRESMKRNREQHRPLMLLLATSISVSLAFALPFLPSTRVVGQETEVLSLQTHIQLPGVKGRIDHLVSTSRASDSSWLLSKTTRSK